MYKRIIDGDTIYDRRESTGSGSVALGSEVTNSGCNRDVTASRDHYNPSLRLLYIPRSSNGSLGFHLTRSKWDPYPWVSAVDLNTPAKYNGLKSGDCVLEVNGEDVLGLRISEIAKLVRSENVDSVSLLLWSAGCDTKCNPESLCCGPMPLNLERLSACMQTILSIIECPVCLETIAPPVLQCQNGHILCVKCRILQQACPVCRQRFYPGRSLIAEQIYNSITDTFNLRNQDRLREKLFGAKYKRPTKDENGNGSLKPLPEVNKFGAQLQPPLPTNKFLAKLLGKAYSMDNLSTSSSRAPATLLSMKSTTNQPAEIVKDNDTSNKDDDNFDEQSELANQPKPSLATTISRQFSISAYDLSKKDTDGLIAIERCPSMNRIQYLRAKRNSVQLGPTQTTPSVSLQAELDRKRSCASLSTSMECVTRTLHRENGLQVTTGDEVRPPIPRIQISCCTEEQRENCSYLCPCNCGNQFSGSTLQQHVKVDHSAPILCYGRPSAELSLPLRAPLDRASVLLVCAGKDFWIKLRADGEGSITASALLQGTEDESLDFMMETRLRNRIDEDQDDKDVVLVVANNDGNGDGDGGVGVDEDDDGILERELITRSIVRSMMVTTWEDTHPLDSRHGVKRRSSSSVLYNPGNIRMTFGESIDYRNLLLKIIIKRRVPRETVPSGNEKWLGVQ